MAEIAVCCPQCGRIHRVDATVAGKRARCKTCGELFRIPADPAPIEPAPARAVASTGDPRATYELVDPPAGDGAEAGPPRLHPASGELPVRGHGPSDSPGTVVASPKPPRAGRPGPGSSGRRPLAPVRLVGLLGSLALLGVAAWSLGPHAWDAGHELLGQGAVNPNELPARGPGRDPDLEIPDVAPERVDVVRQHRKVLEEMAGAYMDMSMGYTTMRNRGSLASGRDEVAQASRKLAEAAGRGAALPRLEATEKLVLGDVAENRLKPAVARVMQEINRLKQTPGLQGDFDKMLAAMNQSQRQFDREFPRDPRKPAVLLVMRKIADLTQRKLIIDKASALGENINSGGWGDEGERSVLKLAPVLSARAFADRINFGKVKRVEGRRIELDLD